MNRHPLQPITQEHQEVYARDGVVCVRGMFDEEWVAKMRTAVDEVVASAGEHGVKGPSHSEEFLSIIYLWRRSGAFRDYILNSPAAEIVGRVLGAKEIRAFQDHLFIKPLGSPHIMAWHHDATTWPMRGEQVPTLWLALTKVTAENGRLEFVAGLHKELMAKDIIYRTGYKHGTFGPTDGTPCPNFDDMRNDPSYRFVAYDLEPGDALLFHPRTPHGSKDAINAKVQRIGLTSRWIGDDITWHVFPGTVPIPDVSELPEGDRPNGEHFPIVWRNPAIAQAAD